MKVLMQSRQNLFSDPGGDTVQVNKTMESLEKLGVTVDCSVELTPDISNYDIVHVFNITRPHEAYLQVNNAKKYGKKVVLSTIYVDYWEYERYVRGGFLGLLAKCTNRYFVEKTKVLLKCIKHFEVHDGFWQVLKKPYLKVVQQIVSLSDLLLPNSESEMDRLINNFVLDRRKLVYRVVPNAVDIDFFSRDKVIHVPKDLLPFKGCVMCAGRIEGRKNQLKMVEALADTKYNVVLAGQPSPNSKSYFKEIEKIAASNVFTLGQQDKERLRALYSIAKVHILPSWMETTGLTSLEAGVMGCNIVVTEKGDTREYFGDKAFYCDPASTSSIRDSVAKAFSAPRNAKLVEHIKNNYNWGKAAEVTLSAYESIL
ncbi:glycosyltransferase family 4 protein [Candidatus Dojkabacteria bacterium]|nr:glycosyltransferase family 4 protein [Candidatus Dojkabacteria bacterium]